MKNENTSNQEPSDTKILNPTRSADIRFIKHCQDELNTLKVTTTESDAIPHLCNQKIELRADIRYLQEHK